MDKSHRVNTPVVLRSLSVVKDPSRSWKANEELLGFEVPYLDKNWSTD